MEPYFHTVSREHHESRCHAHANISIKAPVLSALNRFQLVDGWIRLGPRGCLRVRCTSFLRLLFFYINNYFNHQVIVEPGISWIIYRPYQCINGCELYTKAFFFMNNNHNTNDNKYYIAMFAYLYASIFERTQQYLTSQSTISQRRVCVLKNQLLLVVAFLFKCFHSLCQFINIHNVSISPKAFHNRYKLNL